MRGRSPGPDLAVAELAARQHGVLSLRQLVALGLSRRAVQGRIARGWLHRVHRGVYAVGHPNLSREGLRMAALLAGGDDAALAFWSAGAHWGFAREDPTAVHVRLPRGMHDRPGLRFHRGRLQPSQRTTFRGIPITTPPQTLVDLAGVMAPHELQRAVHQAQVDGRCHPRQLRRALGEQPHCRGAVELRRVLGMAGGRSLPTRSELEDRFLRVLARHGLELPQTNPRIETPRGQFEVDCLWPAAAFVVELDGARYHGTEIAKQRDSRKDRALATVGLRTMHVTWRDLDDDEEAVVADVIAGSSVSPTRS